MHRQKQLKRREVKWLNNNKWEVTIEDGVYSLVIEVKMESVFDNGKGRMIQTTDMF